MADDKIEVHPADLRGWAADPAANGRVPVHPNTLYALADELDRLAADARRWREYLHTEPESMRHLLRLLLDGKGKPEDLDRMVDRILDCKQAALFVRGAS